MPSFKIIEILVLEKIIKGFYYIWAWRPSWSLIIIIIIIIIIISIFREDNVLSMIASLPYGPPVNTDIDYYRTFFGLFYFL